MEKSVRNTDKVAHKLKPAQIRATNQRLEVAREKRRKREEIVKRRKTEAMVAKRQRVRRGISLAIEKEENY